MVGFVLASLLLFLCLICLRWLLGFCVCGVCFVLFHLLIRRDLMFDFIVCSWLFYFFTFWLFADCDVDVVFDVVCFGVCWVMYLLIACNWWFLVVS